MFKILFNISEKVPRLDISCSVETRAYPGMYTAITSQHPVQRGTLSGVTAQGIQVCPLKHNQTMQFI